MAASLDALASRVEDMSVEQVEEAAVRVVSETGHVRGLEKSPESSTFHNTTEQTQYISKGSKVAVLATYVLATCAPKMEE